LLAHISHTTPVTVHVFASSSYWSIDLFASVVIGQSNYIHLLS